MPIMWYHTSSGTGVDTCFPYKLFDMVCGTKLGTLLGPKGSFAFLFVFFLSPISGVRVSGDDPSRR